MIATVFGCLALLVAVKLLFAWVSRPTTSVHLHVPPAAPASVVYCPFPVPMVPPAVSECDGDAELHGLIDDYYREHGPAA